MNVPHDCLDAVVQKLPSLTAPTIARLHNADWLSVETIIREDVVRELIPQLIDVGADGIIVGSFTNGLTRNLGQVVLATFRNYEGLVAMTDNLYATGPNSSSPMIKTPQELGAGSIKMDPYGFKNKLYHSRCITGRTGSVKCTGN